MWIGQVTFDDRLREGFERVKQGDRGVAVTSRIYYEHRSGFARLLNPVNQFAFVIGLTKHKADVFSGGQGLAARLDVVKTGISINFRFPHPKKVEVRAIEDIYGFRHCAFIRRVGVL